MGGQLREFFWSDPLYATALGVSLFALATTPVAFAVLGRMGWFQARRGRTVQKPSFVAVVVGMMLVMGIPAILVAMLVKSRYFDRNRYEFDPNRTLSVLDQGRQFESLKLSESLYKADEAVRAEMERLANERKELVNNVKRLDEAMLTLRSAAATSPATAQALPDVLQRLAGVRKSIGLDGPQQLEDFTAPPAALAGTPGAAAPVAVAPSVAAAPVANVPPPAPGAGLSTAEREAELGKVPAPQKALAALLPLTDLPPGWVVGKNMGPSGQGRLETFNAANLFEKIDGRAESFLQYDVQGMAYTFYHPAGDEATEAQLYIFDMKTPLNALGKYGTEKTEGVKTIELGTEGYTSAGSTFFHAGPYYVQIVATSDDPKLAAFSLEIARRIAGQIKPKPSAATAGGDAPADPSDVLKLLPDKPDKKDPKYVAQDVFGYSFLSDVFMADYAEGNATWQGFLRPYKDADEAKAVFEKYVASAEQDGAKIKEVEGSGADRLVVAANADLGLTDVLFLKGNAIGGANGAAEAGPAEAFARGFAQVLPAKVPYIATQTKGSAAKPERAGEPEGEGEGH